MKRSSMQNKVGPTMIEQRVDFFSQNPMKRSLDSDQPLSYLGEKTVCLIRFKKKKNIYSNFDKAIFYETSLILLFYLLSSLFFIIKILKYLDEYDNNIVYSNMKANPITK